jgi:predicted TIM-barrel fold metal-dependent hydrolase
MIIDSLTHITPDGRWFHTRYDASLERLLREMDTAQVEKAVVVALAEHIENEFVVQTCEKHADRLVAGVSINPAAYTDPEDAAEAFRTLRDQYAFTVIKLHPRLNRYDPLDVRCLALLDAVGEEKHPTLIWLDTLFRFRGGTLRKPPVDAIHELLRLYPGLTFILLHSCGVEILTLAEAVRDCPNAYLDLSYTLHRYRETHVNQNIRFLVQNFEQRIIFGSDFPEISIPDALATLQKTVPDHLSGKLSCVMGGNLQKILQLDGR